MVGKRLAGMTCDCSAQASSSKSFLVKNNHEIFGMPTGLVLSNLPKVFSNHSSSCLAGYHETRNDEKEPVRQCRDVVLVLHSYQDRVGRSREDELGFKKEKNKRYISALAYRSLRARSLPFLPPRFSSQNLRDAAPAGQPPYIYGKTMLHKNKKTPSHFHLWMKNCVFMYEPTCGMNNVCY